MAGTSSFGIIGVNSHLLLATNPSQDPSTTQEPSQVCLSYTATACKGSKSSLTCTTEVLLVPEIGEVFADSVLSLMKCLQQLSCSWQVN